MLLRLTEKMARKLKTGPLPANDADHGRYLEWYANLFTVDRVQYILTTEAQSLFSIIMYGRGVTDDGIYLDRLLSELREYLFSKGNRLILERVIVPHAREITLAKTRSRSVLGSMNDMVLTGLRAR